MQFRGKELDQKDAQSMGGGWVRLADDQPVRLTIVEYVGKFASKKYPDNFQYRFTVQTQDGQAKKLDCNWRLMKALMEHAEQFDSPFTATILQTKVIAEIETPDGTKQKKLVNEYTLTEVKSWDGVPF